MPNSLPDQTEKTLAMWAILCESDAKRSTKAGLKRVRKAGKVLGFNDDEQKILESQLEFRGSDGELYGSLR